MQTKIFLDDEDQIVGSGGALTIVNEGEALAAIFFPLDLEKTLRLCSEVADGIEQIRRRALSELRAAGSTARS